MESPTPAATGQPAAAPVTVEPTTVSAAEAALSRGDVSAYHTARNAERTGKPLADVATEPAKEPTKEPATAVPVAAKGPKPKDVEADDRLRSRVAEAVTPLQTEIAQLRADLARARGGNEPPKAPAQDTAPAKARFPSIAEWSEKHPDKSFDDYLEARDDFRDDHRASAQREQTAQSARIADLTKRSETFAGKLRAAAAADPDLKSKLPPDVLNARPLSALSPEEFKTATFANLVAEAGFRADNPAELFAYLHAHQDETARIAGMRPDDALLALARIDGRIGAAAPPAAGPEQKPSPAAATAAAPSPISAAPPPAPILSRPGSVVDPKEAALARGDVTAYHRIRNQERIERARG